MPLGVISDGYRRILANRQLVALIVLLAIGVVTLFAARAHAATYSASPTAGGSICSVDAPCALDTALGMLKAGDTLLLRGGAYRQEVYVGASGTEASPIVISSYPGDVAVIDGEDRIPASDWGVLLLVEGAHVTIQNLEVRNSLWMGVRIAGDHSSAVRVTSHDHWENGILLSGDYTLADGCFVYNNARSNENCVMARDSWASGLSAAREPVGATIRGSTVWHNWGEGISTYEATQTIIEDNVAYDNFSVNLYLSDATHVLAQRNVVYATGAMACDEASQVGIAISSEGKEPSNSDITLINNAVYGTRRNFYYFTSDVDGMVNTLIAHNTFVHSTYETNFKILAGDHLNTRIVNKRRSAGGRPAGLLRPGPFGPHVLSQSLVEHAVRGCGGCRGRGGRSPARDDRIDGRGDAHGRLVSDPGRLPCAGHRDGSFRGFERHLPSGQRDGSRHGRARVRCPTRRRERR